MLKCGNNEPCLNGRAFLIRMVINWQIRQHKK
nr:MAG TPA: hypothetical protein [Caudoviricetes sp.]